jgi:AraC-like DNA-binding protein
MKYLQSETQASPIRIPLRRIDWEALAQQSGFRLPDLVVKSGYSMRMLQRFIRARFHCSLGEFLRRIRVQHASRLLADGETVKHVAIEVGYKQTSHFIRHFKDVFGVTPGALRERTQELEL